MALFPGADTSRILTQFKTNMARYRGVVLHVAVSESAFPSYGPGLGAHFYVRKNGVIVQQIDTAFKGGHAYLGNSSTIGIETQGGVVDAQNEPWTPEQVEALARLVQWLNAVHGIPLRLMESSRESATGLGYHRQGCAGNYDAAHPGIVIGGESWTHDRGKICPGNAKIDQRPAILARAIELAGGAITVSQPIQPPAAPAPAPAEVQVGWTIRKGDRGPGVVDVEQILAALGFYGGDIDGIAGNQFDAATRAFQRAAGIDDDGAFGPVSRLMARNIPAFPGLTVRGSHGAAPEAFQQRLKNRGWKISVDGDHGPATTKVLRAFQAEKGLSVDGAGGPQTWTALYTRSL